MPGPRSRRDLLRLGGAALGGFAGCLSDGTGAGPERTTTASTHTTTTTGTEKASDDHSRFAGRPCPTFLEYADRTVCYHAIDHEDPPPAYLEPSTEQVSEWDGVAIEFTFRNRSDRTVAVVHCHPRVYRRRAEGWVRYWVQGGYVQCDYDIDPGGEYRWGVGRNPPESGDWSDGEFLVEDTYPPGRYAFVVRSSPVNEDASVVHAALFEVETDGPSTTTATRTARKEYPSEAVRCRGDPVSVEVAKTDEAGYEDNIKYYPSNRTVKFVETRTGEGPASFGQWTLREWARFAALGRLRERVRDVTRERLGTKSFYVRQGDPPASADVDSPVFWVRASATETVDGGVVPAPVSLAELADAAPRTARATASLDGDAVELDAPVFAQITTE